MLKNLGHWTQLSAIQKAEIRMELDIPEVIVEHVRWKTLLCDHVNGIPHAQLDFGEVFRDDRCELGEWLHGAGEEYFHEDGAFYTLRADHAEFHSIAANVVRKVSENDLAAARAMLYNEFAHVTHKVVQALVELSCQVEAR